MGCCCNHPTYIVASVDMARKDAVIYLAIAAYAFCGTLFLTFCGAADRAAPFLYFTRWGIRILFLLPAGALLFDFCWVLHRFDKRRRLALKKLFSVGRIARLASGTLLLFAFTLFQGVFTSIKNGLPVWQGGFPYDRLLAELDAALHFGVDPWRLLYAAAKNDVLLSIMEWNYGMLWFVICYGALIFVATSPKASYVRLRYLLCFMLVWIVVGNIFAGLFMSAGPAFYELVSGDKGRFAEQLSYLHAAGNNSVLYQDYLWRLQEAGSTGFASGISAFPSIHVALAAMNAMFAWSYDRRLGLLAWFYTGFVLFSSVYLAWHYAIDGYAGIFLAAAIFVIVGRFSRLAGPYVSGRLASTLNQASSIRPV